MTTEELAYPKLDKGFPAYPALPDDILEFCLPRVSGQAFQQAQIPWDRIEKHPLFPNSRAGTFGTTELEAGIDELGLETPIVVWRHHDEKGWPLLGEGVFDRFFVISGFRRY